MNNNNMGMSNNMSGGGGGGNMNNNNNNAMPSFGLSVNPNQHYEMLKLHHMNLLNEIQETTLMMNLYQQQQLQQQGNHNMGGGVSCSIAQHMLPFKALDISNIYFYIYFTGKLWWWREPDGRRSNESESNGYDESESYE